MTKEEAKIEIAKRLRKQAYLGQSPDLWACRVMEVMTEFLIERLDEAGLLK